MATAWEVQERVSEVHGGQLAGAVTLSAFTAIFPLLLAVAAVIGFVAHNQSDLADRAIHDLKLTGTAATTLRETFATAERTRATATAVGVAGLLWSGLGLVAGLEAVFDAVWQIGGRGWKGKLIDTTWLVGAVVLVGGSAALTALISRLPGPLGFLTIVAGLAVNVALWLWTFVTLTNRRVPWRTHLPGAILGAVGLLILTAVGTLYVPHAVASASAVYGTIGVILALLGWLLLLARLLVYAAVLNVVLWERGHGTVTVELELPRIPGDVPLSATRAGGEVP